LSSFLWLSHCTYTKKICYCSLKITFKCGAYIQGVTWRFHAKLDILEWMDCDANIVPGVNGTCTYMYLRSCRCAHVYKSSEQNSAIISMANTGIYIGKPHTSSISNAMLITTRFGTTTAPRRLLCVCTNHYILWLH
jgi:hypothetical protein